METLSKRRISDVQFVVDANLNVIDGNRSFMSLFRQTQFNVNFSMFLSEFDAENFRGFLRGFGTDEQPHDFIAGIALSGATRSCIFSTTKKGAVFNVVLEELSFSRMLLDRALLESREYSALLQNFDVYYFIYDGTNFILKNTKDLNIVFEGKADEFSDYFQRIFSIDLVHNDTCFQYKSMFENIQNFESNKYYNFLQTTRKLLTVHTLKTSTRKKTVIVGSIESERNSAPAQNQYSEQRDGLTGLYNKKAITELAVQKINEKKEPCALIIIDVDKFKEFNDTYGHFFGDRVLVAVANSIADAISGYGIAGRIGGDEFLIVLDMTDEDDIRNIARNIRVGIQWNVTAEPGTSVTCSIGIARFPMNVNNYEDLFNLADKCLYIAKYRGRNCYIIYKPELHDKILLEKKQAADKISSGKLFMDNVNTQMEIFSLFDTRKSDFIKKAIERAQAYMQISKITVYDKNLDLAYVVGVDGFDVRMPFFDDDYFSFYNEYDFLHLDNTNILDSIDAQRFNMYISRNISSTIEVLCKDESGARKALVCYDLYKPARTFSPEKVIFAIMLAKKIAQYL